MFCKHCGKRIADDSTFCQYCGGRQGSTVTPAAPTSAKDDFADLDSFFSSAVSEKRAADAKAAEIAKRFEIRDGVLVKYNPPEKPESHVVIPDGVTSIGDNVFRLAYWLTEVTLPNTLQRIGDWAFAGSLLETITLPDSVVHIGSFAFQATRLREITFPERITRLPNSVLSGCMFLERVTLPSRLTAIGNDAFSRSTLPAIHIPASVTEICPGAFAGCDRLTAITLPRGLKSLGARAFSKSGLTSLQLPDGITEVPMQLCAECHDLETVTLGKYTVIIGGGAFWYCHSLKTVRCGDMLESIGGGILAALGPFAVREGTPTETLTLYIPATLREIRDYSFGNRQDSKLFVEFEGSYAQWKAVTKTENFRDANPANVNCHGAPSVGETYLFGSYMFHDTVKPIEWIVLSVGADRMLLLSKYVLDGAAYYHDYAPVTWERSDLRRWLNDTFFNTAFGFADQNRILTTTVINENNPKFRTKGGSTTSDKLFCLSISEYENLPYRHKFAESTPYASYRVEYAAECNADGDMIQSAYWWLRTPGGFDWDDEDHGKESHWASFACGKDIMSMGVEKASVGVRPAMWVKM